MKSKMAAGGNVEVVWSDLLNYLSPTAPKVLGMKHTHLLNFAIFNIVISIVHLYFQEVLVHWKGFEKVR